MVVEFGAERLKLFQILAGSLGFIFSVTSKATLVTKSSFVR
jgi:hypothetical protein